MKRRPSGTGDIPGQFQIEWNAPTENRSAVMASPPPVSRHEALAQSLPWDFKTTFPQPTQEAIDAGIISDEDTTAKNIKAIHEEYARELRGALRAMDAVADAKRRGVDPVTGRAPTNSAGQQRLRTLLANEPGRLERWWQNLLGVYADAFGGDAADAFGKAIRAWHAGIEVTTQAAPAASLTGAEVEEQNAPAVSPRRNLHSCHRRTAHLPVPRPLPCAVAAGRFGRDEHGKRVRPDAREVREITEQHAEKLIALLDSLASAPSAGKPQLLESFQIGIKAYEEDFGAAAAAQLDAYVRRQAGLGSGSRRGR